MRPRQALGEAGVRRDERTEPSFLPILMGPGTDPSCSLPLRTERLRGDHERPQCLRPRHCVLQVSIARWEDAWFSWHLEETHPHKP